MYILLFTHCSIPKLEGKTNEQALQNVKERIIPTMKANYCLWPIVQVH